MTQTKGKITLISVDEYGPAIGTRFLSSALKEAGYHTIVIFAFGAVDRSIATGESRAFSDNVHREIAALSEGSIYIGISVATPTFHKAREITGYLKSHLDIPIIWGGVHAAVKPGECLKYADMVCPGEGEHLAVSLAERLTENKPYGDIPGLMIPGQSREVKVQPLPDISHFPAPDYSFDGTHYMAIPQQIEPFTAATYFNLGGTDYYFSPTRGCPYKCAYCIHSCNNQTGRFRSRDIDDSIKELIRAKTHIPVVRKIMIDDDCFMALGQDKLRYFAQEYEKHVALPFIIRGAHPQNITDEKLRFLGEAGLDKLRVGIQTGSKRIQELYNRSWQSNEKVLRMAGMVNKAIKQGYLKFIMYDIILDNPWETTEDCRRTFDLISSLPHPFGIYCFSLRFYPGTALYNRALAEGLIRGDSLDEAYWTQYWELEPTPINQVYHIFQRIPLSPRFMRFLVKTRKSSFPGIAADALRGIFRKLTLNFPEVSLFSRTLNRYRRDFQVKYDAKITHENWKNQLKQERKKGSSRIAIALRRFLVYVYIKLFAPGRLFPWTGNVKRGNSRKPGTGSETVNKNKVPG